ncbi:helix-turn-helix transcriptional regulator [Tenacibaculum agarivorans]|uniref:helix-turn-helix transcriptional regulator n=1 Tax=Tenacibaculum agarivorans TaxID=1908389 RepID=UPI00094BB868|nr:hypothetical protein [Tenacibaculum agarivorans]
MNYIKNDIFIIILLISFLNVKAYSFKKLNFNPRNINRYTTSLNAFNTEIFKDYSTLKYTTINNTLGLVTFLNSNKNNEYIFEEQYNLDSKLLKVKQKFRYLLIMFIIVFLLLTTCLIFMFSKFKKSTIKNQSSEIKEQINLQKHIKQKEQEILATLIAVSTQQEELIQTLKVVEDLKDEKPDPKLQKVYNRLKKITKSSSNLNLIFQKLESQYSYFSTSIKDVHPNLTKNDIRNCILLRLGFSLKDSAELLNVSVHAIKIARQRIKKKINYKDQINLKEYLDTFQNHQSFPKKV